MGYFKLLLFIVVLLCFTNTIYEPFSTHLDQESFFSKFLIVYKPIKKYIDYKNFKPSQKCNTDLLKQPTEVVLTKIKETLGSSDNTRENCSLTSSLLCECKYKFENDKDSSLAYTDLDCFNRIYNCCNNLK